MTCYANGAVVWGALVVVASRSTFRPSDWGQRSALFLDLIHHHQHTQLALAEQDWFNQLSESWPEGEGTGQSDSAEFLQLFMQWVQPIGVSCYWEKRVLRGDRPVVEDCGAQFMPMSMSSL
jgi:hypothetical protein